MRQVRCPDAGVECLGYGEVTLKVQAVPRVKKEVAYQANWTEGFIVRCLTGYVALRFTPVQEP